MDSIREQLKRRRKALHLTQDQMMLRVGMSRQQYQRLESKGNPTLKNLELIAKGLKMELMLVPQEKLFAVKTLLEEPSIAGQQVVQRNLHDQNDLSDDPWKDLLDSDD